MYIMCKAPLEVFGVCVFNFIFLKPVKWNNEFGCFMVAFNF